MHHGGFSEKKIETKAIIWPSYITPGLKDSKSAHDRDTCMFNVACFTIAKIQNHQRRCPSVDEWLEKMWHRRSMQTEKKCHFLVNG